MNDLREQLKDRENRDLLIMAIEEVKHLRKDFDKVSNDTGFPRCVERNATIQDTRSDLDKHIESHRWYHRKIIGAAIVLTVGVWWDKLMLFLKALLFS